MNSNFLKCEIIAVGNELLFGDVVNTNASFLSKKLADLGVIVKKHTVVADDEIAILNASSLASKENDIVIFSGGLGPTDDDLTKEVLAKFLDLDLVLDEYSLKEIRAYFSSKGRKMAKNNEKQALKPTGALCLKNKNGTAPGIYLEKDGVHYFLLPGPPGELAPMFEAEVIPIIKGLSNTFIASKMISIMGIGESDIAEILGDKLDNDANPKIAPYASPGVVNFKITAYADTEAEAASLVEEKRAEVLPILQAYLLSEDGKKIEEVIIDLLRERGETLSIAESCTGGMVAANIVSVSGASEVFLKGAVTYSNESKVSDLGVDEAIIEDFGAVSEECARAMASGVRERAGASFGVAITGIAGPDGGSDEKPVGTVFIAVSGYDGVKVKKYIFSGNRAKVRLSATRFALIDLLKYIKKI